MQVWGTFMLPLWSHKQYCSLLDCLNWLCIKIYAEGNTYMQEEGTYFLKNYYIAFCTLGYTGYTNF